METRTMTRKKASIGKILFIGALCSGILWLTVLVLGIFTELIVNGFDFSLERKLTKESKQQPTCPGNEFDVEFPDKSASEANSIAQDRIGRSFYSNAMAQAANQTCVKDAVGNVTEIRPAKGENAFYPPFTDGDGGGTVTVRLTGDKGVIVVSVRGHGPQCLYPSIDILAVKSLTDDGRTRSPGLSQPIRLLDKKIEADYDQTEHSYSLRENAEKLEKEGKREETEKAWMLTVAQSERKLDSKNLAAIRYQMAADYKQKKCWTPPILLSALSDLAEYYERHKEPAKERKILRQLITVDEALCPENISGKPEGLRKLAQSYEREGQLKDAIECVAEELALYEKNPPPFRSYTKRRARKYQELLENLNRTSVAEKPTPHNK